jgi:hypothetical protein
VPDQPTPPTEVRCNHCLNEYPAAEIGEHMRTCLRESRVPQPPQGTEGRPR